ncbi:MAG: hypothetical protein IPG43_01295 [Proteobacteria bacterium]|nr:hypothetical protein [Pseudomonadota bacterium]
MTRYEQGGFSERYRADFNDKVNLIFDGVKNYVFTHYKLKFAQRHRLLDQRAREHQAERRPGTHLLHLGSRR